MTKTAPPPGTKPNIIVMMAEKGKDLKGREVDSLGILSGGWPFTFDQGTTFFGPRGRSPAHDDTAILEVLAMTPRAFWTQFLLATEMHEIEIIERLRDVPAPEAWDELIHAELQFVPGVANAPLTKGSRCSILTL
ncbi:MAG: hypothetical protein KAJ19_11945 [Gammaproteobacteria bacterium]|nr:hypothetical protein [Gammaproteobacteria bacterium]